MQGYKVARRAEAGEKNHEYHKITAQDAIDAGVLRAEEIEDARREFEGRGKLSAFRELYFCEPSDDGGNPFGIKAIQSCIMPMQSISAVAVFGVDLAKSCDWTWIIGLDEAGHEVFSERWQGDWGRTRSKLVQLIGDTPAKVDSTGVGDPIVEDLQRQCAAVQSYKFTSQSKQQLMEGLASGIQRQMVRFADKILINELETFEYEYTRTGVRYTAPEGLHDDGVCALALAYRCLGEFGKQTVFYSRSDVKIKPELVPSAKTFYNKYNEEADDDETWR